MDADHRVTPGTRSRSPAGLMADVSSEDEVAALGAAAMLRSIKRKHMNSRSVSPVSAEPAALPGITQTSWLASSDEQTSPEAARQRRAHGHTSAKTKTLSGKVFQSSPQKLRRKERKASAAGASTQDTQTPKPESPRAIGHPSISSPGSERPHSPGNAPQGSHMDQTESPRSVEQWYPGVEEPLAANRTQHTSPQVAPEEFQHPVPGKQRPPQSPHTEPDGPAPPVDPRKMLLLMRKTAGRMQGQLMHRVRGSHSWIRSHCFIEPEAGTLMSEDEILGQQMCLFRNLKQCKVQAHLHTESNSFILQLTTFDYSQSLQLSPPDQLLFNAWFAAFLCWKPVPQSEHLSDKAKQHRPILIRQISDYLPAVDLGVLANPVRKVGNAVLIEPDLARAGPTSPTGSSTRTRWRTVSCTLNARGELRVHSKSLVVPVSVQLSELPRSAIQKISATVLGADCVIAIYPQYGQNVNACSRIRPVYLSLESRELFEVWYVLMRAHAIPELFGASRMQAASESGSPSEFLPGIKQDTSPPLFRIANTLRVQVKEARIGQRMRGSTTPEPLDEDSPRIGKRKPPHPNYFAEVLLDGHVKARSTFKFDTADPLWYESFEFADLPNMLSAFAVRLKKQAQPSPTTGEESPASPYAMHDDAADDATLDKPDVVCGTATFERALLEERKDIQGWFDLQDENGSPSGEISLRVRFDQRVVLMDQEYDAISDLLHKFSNCLTLQICERIPDKLAQLSATLLNIFQVSGQAGEWLMFLAEEEIDGVRETAPGKQRYARRLESTESRESLKHADREDIVRDMGRSAHAEANLLFRGNTLLSKALDLHMRRLGGDYLESTLGEQLRTIARVGGDCEVDPAKMTSSQSMSKNWRRLIGLTEQTWSLIVASVKQCPVELRIIFRHIRACADDRYGDYLRTVPYSAVSGFVFLRFFCAAILNPQLFLLVDSAARPEAQRTYVLIAKSLQGLANMTTFGQKETWMTPMNTFLNSNRQAFKKFIDDICDVPTDEQLPIPPSYNIPYIIFQKSPLTSREGFPSLPHLIDRAQNLASLVDVWLEGVSSAASDGSAPPGTSNQLTGDLARFHDFCLGLHQRTRAAFRSADRSAGMTGSPWNHRWSAIAQQMEIAPEDFWVKQRGELTPREAARAQASSPLGRKLSAARVFGHQTRSGSRGGREEPWKPLTIRRRAGSQPVAGPAVGGRTEEPARYAGSESEGEGEPMGRPFKESQRPMTPQTEERDHHWKHFWRKRGLTPDKRESTL